MTAKAESDGPIQPDILYTLEQAARSLGVTPRYFREKLVVPEEVNFVPLGRTSVTMGWEIIRWAERNLGPDRIAKEK